MAIRDTWHRALVYFGLAEYYDEGPEMYEPETSGGEEPFDAPGEDRYDFAINRRHRRPAGDEDLLADRCEGTFEGR